MMLGPISYLTNLQPEKKCKLATAFHSSDPGVQMCNWE